MKHFPQLSQKVHMTTVVLRGEPDSIRHYHDPMRIALTVGEQMASELKAIVQVRSERGDFEAILDRRTPEDLEAPLIDLWVGIC